MSDLTRTADPARRAPRSWAALAIAWASAAGALAAWLSRTDDSALREQLKSLQFWNFRRSPGRLSSTSACAAPGLI